MLPLRNLLFSILLKFCLCVCLLIYFVIYWKRFDSSLQSFFRGLVVPLLLKSSDRRFDSFYSKFSSIKKVAILWKILQNFGLSFTFCSLITAVFPVKVSYDCITGVFWLHSLNSFNLYITCYGIAIFCTAGFIIARIVFLLDRFSVI